MKLKKEIIYYYLNINLFQKNINFILNINTKMENLLLRQKIKYIITYWIMMKIILII